jgi:hypothetical protein
MGDNDSGFHHKRNENPKSMPTRTYAPDFSPMPPSIRPDAPLSVAPHGSTDNLAPSMGKHDRHLTSGAAANPSKLVKDARAKGGDATLKYGANHGPSGRK